MLHLRSTYVPLTYHLFSTSVPLARLKHFLFAAVFLVLFAAAATLSSLADGAHTELRGVRAATWLKSAL